MTKGHRLSSHSPSMKKQDFENILTTQLLPLCSLAVWPAMLAIPLALSSSSSPIYYRSLFPRQWYELEDGFSSPKPLGLFLGVLAVGIGQIFTTLFFFFWRNGSFSRGKLPIPIQKSGPRSYEFMEGLWTHVAQPEGFLLLGLYLTVTWMFRVLPAPYYSFEGGIRYHQVALCLMFQDAVQFVMHWLEHVVSPKFYQVSHKPHHRFTNPRLFDAFNGSIGDTLFMIIIPLLCTSQVVRNCNVWTYMAFGSVYACWLTLIHSEYTFLWDPVFRVLGLGTPADHHVHHKLFNFNFGHLFMWWDVLCSTYRNPRTVERYFNQGA